MANAPTNVVATRKSGRVELTWAKVVGATSYSVKQSLKTGGPTKSSPAA